MIQLKNALYVQPIETTLPISYHLLSHTLSQIPPPKNFQPKRQEKSLNRSFQIQLKNLYHDIYVTLPILTF